MLSDKNSIFLLLYCFQSSDDEEIWQSLVENIEEKEEKKIASIVRLKIEESKDV